MKKTFTLSAMLALSILSISATPLTPQQSLQRAANSSGSKKTKGLHTNDLRLVMTGNTTHGQPAYYVFTNAVETLFLPADDIAVPVLGYTYSGDFNTDNMPPSMKWWLESYARELEWATSNSKKMNSGKAPAPQKEKSEEIQSRQPISPMLTTIWNQSQPFNRYCPEIDGTLTVTGCVATSISQVMNYFQWPQTTVSPISYEWNNQTLTSPSTKFDWDNMLDSYNGDYTDTQADAVARLMQVVGYAVSMNYNTAESGGSGARYSNIREALVNNFGYDVAADYVIRDFYSIGEWNQMMYDNLLNCGPILYGGNGDRGGHSFVCDGYEGNNFFHINWGWGGHYDGYFLLSALNPDGLGIGGGSGEYNYNQNAVIGIQRPKPGSVAPVPFLGCTSEITGWSEGRTLYIGAINNGGYYNFGVETAVFHFGVQLENQVTGTVHNVYSFYQELEPDYGYTYYFTPIPDEIPEGKYRVRPIYQLGNSDEWLNMRFYNNFPYVSRDSFDITITQEAIEIDNNEEITLVSWESETGFASGMEYTGYLTVESTSSTPQELTLDASLCVISDDRFSTVEELGNSTVTIPAYSSVEMMFSGTLGCLNAGRYYLVFKRNSEVLGWQGVIVTDEGEISLLTWECNDLVSGQSYNGVLTIENTHHTPRECSYDLFLCSYGDDEIYHIQESLGNSTVTVAGQATAEMKYSGTLGDIEPGDYYLVLAENYQFITAWEVTVYRGTIICKGVTIDPEILVQGEESVIDYCLTNNYPAAEAIELGLYICTYEDNTYHGALLDIENIDLLPGEEQTLRFTTTVPEDIEDGIYYLVLANAATNHIYHVEAVTVNSLGLTRIGDIESESGDIRYRYFDLNGTEIFKSYLAPGLYIRYDGHTSTKVLIK